MAGGSSIYKAILCTSGISMTENMSDDSSPTKKRKANDGRATVSGSTSHDGGGSRDGTTSTVSTTCGGENLAQKMDTMMQMMSRMEERCCRLEAECVSLKNTLNNLSQSSRQQSQITDVKNEVLHNKLVRNMTGQHHYSNMLIRNQSWKYTTPVDSVYSLDIDGFTEEVAQYISTKSACLKDLTEQMMDGDFPTHDNNKRGIDLDWDEDDPILHLIACSKMLPHWAEFADALEQFLPAFCVLPDDCETYFSLKNVQLSANEDDPEILMYHLPERNAALMLKEALLNKPFHNMTFVNKADIEGDEGMCIEDILEILESNKILRKLTIGNTPIGRLDHMEKLCSILCHRSIVELDLRDCFENGLGDAMMTSLLTNNGGLAKLERLCFTTNGITPSSVTTLANFLATNPPLRELGLSGNEFHDNDADALVLLANALQSNTSLRRLNLANNHITSVGKEALRLVLQNDSSLNLIADSNHSCCVVLNQFDFWNVAFVGWNEKPDSFNRARKIYNLLSKRNKSRSTPNVQHFDDIDIKLLPSILEAVQRYASVVYSFDRHRPGYCRVEPLSIVYEVMRKWDIVFPLYTDGGDNDNGSIE